VTDSENPKSKSIRQLAAGVWAYVGTALAIIGLVDLTHQLVKWAAFIHKLAERYASIRQWLFSWLPLHIPEEWHDIIIFSLIFISISNLGYYQKTDRLLLREFKKVWDEGDPDSLANVTLREIKASSSLQFGDKLAIKISEFLLWAGTRVFALATVGAFLISVLAGLYQLTIGFSDENMVFTLVFTAFGVVTASMIFTVLIGTGVLLSWRWLIATAVVFVGLVAANEVYVHWLFDAK